MRWTWWHFAALAAVGIGLTVVSFALDWPFAGFFLLLPLIFPPLRFGGSREPRESKRCPNCGFTSWDDEFGYCPRDGARLTRV